MLHAARWKYRTQKRCKKSPSAHHRTTLSGYIFATTVCIDNRKKLVLTIWRTSAHQRLRSVGEFGAPQQVSMGFESWLRYFCDLINSIQHTFGWAAIALCTGPHSSCFLLYMANSGRTIVVAKGLDRWWWWCWYGQQVSCM